MSDRDHGQCLGDETLTEYLEGSLDPAIRAAGEVHLVSCGECRDQLAFFMRVLQPEVNREESAALKAITAEWNKRTGIETPKRRLGYSRMVVSFAAVAAALVIGVSVWIIRERSVVPDSATEVVQLLLGQNRPFETRLASQPHRPIVRTRGADEDADVSYNVLAAEMTRMAANSHEMGRFYLLQKDFSRAIPYLEIAEREAGASAAVHNDLGVAYLESENGPQLQKAELEFVHALQQDESFAAAVFNLALFYERTNTTAQAEVQWKRYLELDSRSDWATEARERLQGLSR